MKIRNYQFSARSTIPLFGRNAICAGPAEIAFICAYFVVPETEMLFHPFHQFDQTKASV